MDRVLGEGYAHRVANAVGKQRSDADGGFDTAVLAVAGFRDTEVDGIIPVRALGIEAGDEQAVGLDHDLRVRGFHREHEIMVAVVAGDAGELQGALAHAEWGIAVAVHDPVGKGAVVRADPHRAAEILAKQDERCELLAYPFQLRLVLVVRVFADLEFLLVSIVAGVHADFLHPFRGLHGGVGFEMNVGDQRHVATGGADFAGDVLKVGGINFRLRGDPHDFTTRLRQIQNLADAGRRIAGVGGDHRLHADRVFPADADISDHDLTRQPPGILKEIGAV